MIGTHDAWPASGSIAATGRNVLIALLIQLAALDADVLTVTPAFALYGLDARLLGVRTNEMPLREDLTTDVDAVARLRTGGGIGVVFVPRPYAPAGTHVPLDGIERLARATG